MTAEFKPKITYRMAATFIAPNMDKKQTPWERLEDWALADKGRTESTLEYITARLQERWPGNYRVERVQHREWPTNYQLVFDNPAEETWFRLRWA